MIVGQQIVGGVLTGRGQHRDEQARIDPRHAFEVGHEVGRLDELAADLEPARDLVGQPGRAGASA